MFDRKNKSSKSSKKSADRAEVTVTALGVTDQQRQQIEQDLASFDPTWDAGECRMSVPLDASTQEQLGQLVSMFPNGDIRLQTTNGDNIIMSGAGGYGVGGSYDSSPGAPENASDEDTRPLPAQSYSS